MQPDWIVDELGTDNLKQLRHISDEDARALLICAGGCMAVHGADTLTALKLAISIRELLNVGRREADHHG